MTLICLWKHLVLQKTLGMEIFKYIGETDDHANEYKVIPVHMK